jgi:hypothetical protein
LGLSILVVAGVVLMLAAAATGSLISAVGTAEQVTQGEFAGFHKYTYLVTWDLEKGLSHLDLILPAGLGSDFQVGFPSDIGLPPDGKSTNDKYKVGDPVNLSVSYGGAFETRDPSIDLEMPLIKWEPTDSVGKVGTGTFWFYTDTSPTIGVFEDLLVAKNGRNATYGDITGACPSSQPAGPVPEPATLALLGIGVAVMLAGRRHSVHRSR